MLVISSLLPLLCSVSVHSQTLPLTSKVPQYAAPAGYIPTAVVRFKPLSNVFAWQQTRMLALAPDTYAKLTQFLLQWAEKHGQQSPDGLRIALFMTHEEIAQNIGSSRESVSRILSDWKHRGVIRVNGGTLTITKPLELETANAVLAVP